MRLFNFDSTLIRVYRILSTSQKFFLGGLIGLQILLGVVDFIGVLLFGVIGGLAIQTVSPGAEIAQVNTIISLMKIESLSLSSQMATLGGLVFSIFLFKTLIAITLTKRIMTFVGQIATQLSEFLITQTLRQPIIFLKRESTQKRLFALTRGVDYVTSFVLAPLVVFIADGAILLIFVIGLFLIQPGMTLALVLLFSILGVLVQLKLNRRSKTLGEECANLNIKISADINEAFSLYREITVRNARDRYVNSIIELRQELAAKTATFSLIPYISKYLIEASVIFFAVFLTVFQFVSSSPVSGIATLTVFLAASTRLAPALLRVQQSIVTVKGNLGLCVPTLDFIEELERELASSEKLATTKRVGHKEFIPEVRLVDVNFTYGKLENFEINNLEFNVSIGERVAIVGPSGSGKSTIVDLILGIVSPVSGHVEISGHHPLESFKIWPREISYVSQDVGMISGTIRENLLLGISGSDFSDGYLLNILGDVGMLEFILGLPKGLDTQVGERGSRLSAGQKQRIGLARALIVQPSLLILDESTSSLDAQSEAKVSTAISNLGADVTVIIVAHRLSTVQSADRIFYIDKGKILAAGTFQDLRSKIPDFDKQAHLSGL